MSRPDRQVSEGNPRGPGRPAPVVSPADPSSSEEREVQTLRLVLGFTHFDLPVDFHKHDEHGDAEEAGRDQVTFVCAQVVDDSIGVKVRLIPELLSCRSAPPVSTQSVGSIARRARLPLLVVKVLTSLQGE